MVICCHNYVVIDADMIRDVRTKLCKLFCCSILKDNTLLYNPTVAGVNALYLRCK